MQFDFRSRVKQLRKTLSRDKLGGFVTVTIEGNNKNVYYLSGFGGTTGALAVSATRAVLAVDARYTARAKKEAKGVQVIEISRGVKKSGNFSHYIGTAVTALALPARSRFGFEASRVPVSFATSWQKHVRAKLVPTEHVVEHLRQVKDAEELKALAHAAKMTDEVFAEVAEKIKPGMRERDIAFMIDVGLRAHGASANSFETIVASGANSAIPHHETSERKVKAGEPAVLDFGGVFRGGYVSDLTRTVFVPGKKPHPKMREAYEIVRTANLLALKKLKPGISWKEYDAVARSYIEERGYGKYFTHGLGHSIGLEAHDPYDYAHDVFRAGTVLSDEPGIYIEGLGGIRIEDDVVVTEKGARRLTRAPYLHV